MSTFFHSVWKNSRITQDTYKIWTQWRQVCGSSGFVQGTGVSTWPLAAEIWRHSRTGVTLQGAWAVIGSSSLKKTDYAQLNHILRKNCLEVGNITDKGWGISIYQSRWNSQFQEIGNKFQPVAQSRALKSYSCHWNRFDCEHIKDR